MQTSLGAGARRVSAAALRTRYLAASMGGREVADRAASCARHARTLGGESPLRGLIEPTASQRQGCPPRGGIRRKPEAKSRPEEHEPQVRPEQSDEFTIPNEVRIYPKLFM